MTADKTREQINAAIVLDGLVGSDGILDNTEINQSVETYIQDLHKSVFDLRSCMHETPLAVALAQEQSEHARRDGHAKYLDVILFQALKRVKRAVGRGERAALVTYQSVYHSGDIDSEKSFRDALLHAKRVLSAPPFSFWVRVEQHPLFQEALVRAVKDGAPAEPELVQVSKIKVWIVW